MAKRNYEVLEHPADLKIRAYGHDLKEVFSNMLRGMFETCRPELVDQKPVIRNIQIKAGDLESLLMDFLSRALYLSDINNEIYQSVDFEAMTGRELRGKIKGWKFKKLQTEIKAVTWYDIKIEKKDNLWMATVLFDI